MIRIIIIMVRIITLYPHNNEQFERVTGAAAAMVAEKVTYHKSK